MEVDQNDSEEDAYTLVFGKEHLGRLWGMRFEVLPYQILRRSFHPRSSSSGGSSLDVNKLKSEFQVELARVDALEQEVAKVWGLEEQLIFLMQQFGGDAFNRVRIVFNNMKCLVLISINQWTLYKNSLSLKVDVFFYLCLMV